MKIKVIGIKVIKINIHKLILRLPCTYSSLGVASGKPSLHENATTDTHFFKFMISGPEVITLFSCSTQLSIKFVMLINIKMPTIVGILTFISLIIKTSESLKARKVSIF